MFYTIYKITNTINGKIYIGCHKTENIDDGYMGSGKYLKRAQEKYGIENFEKEILEVFDNPETMFEMEAKLVNSEFVDSDDTYNLKEGGEGGFDYINSLGGQGERLNNSLTYEKRALGGKRGGQGKKDFYDRMKIEDPEKFQKYLENWSGRTFKGRHHTEESKEKMRVKNRLNSLGEKNSQYGTMWIHNLELKESKKIKKEYFSDWEAKGWLKGRKMKLL